MRRVSATKATILISSSLIPYYKDEVLKHTLPKAEGNSDFVEPRHTGLRDTYYSVITGWYVSMGYP